jgi:hypothetical protein
LDVNFFLNFTPTSSFSFIPTTSSAFIQLLHPNTITFHPNFFIVFNFSSLSFQPLHHFKLLLP